MKAASTNADKAAIMLSLGCTLHCLTLPALIVLLPGLTATIFGDEAFHRWLLLAVIPVSVLALLQGCNFHQRWGLLYSGLVGLCVLTIAACFGHDWFGETGEKLASMLGTALIVASHLRNYHLCRQFLPEARS